MTTSHLKARLERTAETSFMLNVCLLQTADNVQQYWYNESAIVKMPLENCNWKCYLS